MKVINAKDYLELKLIMNYNIQHTYWGLVQKVSSKMYVFVTVTLLMSISKRRIQRTFVIANMTSTNSSLHQIFFTVPSFLAMTIFTIYLGISSTTFYEFHVTSIKKTKKTGPLIKVSYRTVFPFPNLNLVYFERSSRSNLSNIKFQRSNSNS